MDYRTVFLDTNIILDILDTSRQNSKNIVSLLETLVIHKHKVVISEDMLSTVFYINKNNSKILDFFKVIQDRWTIAPFGKNTVRGAIDLSLKMDLDLEDVLQCLCAKENGCDVLITNDGSFCDCGINAMTTEDFLDLHK